MGGNFPAGKREGRDKREKPLIFNTRGRPERKTKVSREPDGISRSRQITKNKNIIKNRSLLKSLLIINLLIIIGF